MEPYQQNILTELVSALKNRESALGTYFRAITKEAIKDLFENESVEFLQQGIVALVHLEDYKICVAFSELLAAKTTGVDDLHNHDRNLQPA